MPQVEWGGYELQEGCTMAQMLSEDNEESFAVFRLSNASKLSLLTGFRKFPEIKILLFYSKKGH